MKNRSVDSLGKDHIRIKGIDLKLDPSVQKICEVYNTSSGSTRSVLYVLLLINVLSLITVLNTHYGNWAKGRIDATEDTLNALQLKKYQAERAYNLKADAVKDTNSRIYKNDKFEYLHRISQLTDKIILTKDVKEFLIKNRIENYQTVKLPILGNSFDVDNLAYISGFSFIILLIVLRLTLTREKYNLRIALQSITERYPDNIIEDKFNPKIAHLVKEHAKSKEELIALINQIRRKHHYNFLSMNEVFNLPYLEVSENTLQNTRVGKFINNQLFYFPYIVYSIVFYNDLSTWQAGLAVSPIHTIILYVCSFIFLGIIYNLSRACNDQKVATNYLFTRFYENNYVILKCQRKHNFSICPYFFYFLPTCHRKTAQNCRI